MIVCFQSFFGIWSENLILHGSKKPTNVLNAQVSDTTEGDF